MTLAFEIIGIVGAMSVSILTLLFTVSTILGAFGYETTLRR